MAALVDPTWFVIFGAERSLFLNMKGFIFTAFSEVDVQNIKGFNP